MKVIMEIETSNAAFDELPLNELLGVINTAQNKLLRHHGKYFVEELKPMVRDLYDHNGNKCGYIIIKETNDVYKS